MERRGRQLVRLFAASAVLPMSPADRVRYFRMAAILRALALGVIGPLMMWLLRDQSPWVVVAVAAWVFPAVPITWLVYRHYGVLAPHFWLRDFVILSAFAALAPSFLVPAMMCILAITAFTCYAYRRPTTIALAIVGLISITVAGAVHGNEAAWIAVFFFPIALASITVPTSISADAMRRSQTINDRITSALRVALWETKQPPAGSDTVFHLYGSSSGAVGPPASTEMTNAEWEMLLHPDDAGVSQQIDDAVRDGHDYRVRYRQIDHSGQFRWIEEVGHLERNEAGAVTNLLGMTQDISRLMQIDEQLTQLDSIVDNLGVGVTIGHLIDPDDPLSLTVVYENRMSHALEPDIARVGRRLADFNPAAFDTTRHRGLGYVIAEVAAGGAPRFIRDAHIRIEGEVHLFSMVISALPNHHVALVLQDLTELHDVRAQLERLAFTDPLTGLANRTRLRQLVAEAPVGSVLAVLDLDKFTEVNESFGHACGDEVIVEVARIVSDTADGVTPARIGGDEFGLLIPGHLNDGRDAARRIMASLQRPVVLPSGLTLQMSASLGVTTKVKTDMSPDELFRQADVAMNRAKRLHTGLETYEPHNDNSAPHRMMLMGELRRAIRGREFELEYQPIVESQTGEIVQLEGLLRWRHPTLGVLPPTDFFEMLHLSNLSGDVTLYMLHEAVDQAAAWHHAGLPVPVAINTGGTLLQSADLVGQIIEVVAAARLPRHAIGLELTERHLMLGTGISIESMQHLADAGIRLSIDHFGTGSSPLAALRHLPAHELKIDRTLVGDLRSGDGSLISGIVTIAHNLGMQLTADGVDDELSLRWLRTNGADRLQGVAIAAPAPAGEIVELLEAQQPLPLAR